MSEKLRRTKERLLDGWDSLWEKLTSKIPRLPRPWRVVRNLVCILLAVCLFWLLMGGEALTPEWAFRRAERQMLVGPSEILLERRDGDMVTIMGRTGYGYFFGLFAQNADPLYGWYLRRTLYVERQEDVTFTVARPDWGVFDVSYVDLLLLCDDPAVSRGEAELTLAGSGSLNGRRYDFDQTYTVELLPEGEGVLSGRVEARSEDDGSWESLLERVMLGNIYDNTVPVTIRLYDGGGALLLERSIQYRYPDI